MVKQHVGEMENPLHLLMNGHRSNYYGKIFDKPVAVHFITMGHKFKNLTVMVIEQLGSAPTERRIVRESYWIHTLRSMASQRLDLDEKIYIIRCLERNAVGGRGLTITSYRTT